MNDANKPVCPTVVTALCGIREDENNSIALKHMSNLDGDSFYLAIENSGGHSPFFFANLGEAQAFIERAQRQLEMYS